MNESINEVRRVADLVKNTQPIWSGHLLAVCNELEGLLKLTALCEEHRKIGGARGNCVICSGLKLSRAIGRIDYVLDEPNEYEVSLYDVDYDEDRVIERAKELRAKRDALRAVLLPEPYTEQVIEYSGIAVNKIETLPLFTADQMRAHGQACVETLRAERDALREVLRAISGPCPTPLQWALIAEMARKLDAAMEKL